LTAAKGNFVNSAAENYRARFRRVLEHIDAHLDSDLSVEELSEVASFSKYHFHRQFTELFGLGVYKYIQLKRLKRASYQLAFHTQQILDIALSSGYEGPEAFARAFRKSIGQSPSEFRKQPGWEPWYAMYQPLIELRATHMKVETTAGQVNIVEFERTRVAMLEHRGHLNLLGDSIRKFIEWRKENKLPPKISATFNLVYDNRELDPKDHRFDLCAATERAIAPNPQGVIEKVIPGGRCAVVRHIGSDDNIIDVVSYLYSEWLPASGEELRDFPLFFQRVKFFPDVPEHEAVTDVFLPLRSD
jgi:AraC family transcriptional regulator